MSIDKEIKELSKSGKTFSDKAKTEILQFWLGHETLEFNRRLFVSRICKKISWPPQRESSGSTL